jgi:hypothetical protein
MGFGKSTQKSNNQSQQTSTSLNQSYPFIQGALGDQVSNAGQGTNAIKALLGLSGDTGQKAAFDNFRNSSGYDFIRNEAVNGITGSQASKGLLSSGSTLKGISKYTSGLASNFLNSYLSQLMGLSDSGIKAAQVISSAGNTANSQGTSFGNSSGSSTNLSLG